MMLQYYLWREDAEHGPYTANDLWQLRIAEDLPDVALVRIDGSKHWLQFWEIRDRVVQEVDPLWAARQRSPAEFSRMLDERPAAGPTLSGQRSTRSRGIFIILGLLGGFFGFHNFYAGHYGRGAAQLVITITLGWIIVGLLINFIWVLGEIIVETTDGEGKTMA